MAIDTKDLNAQIIAAGASKTIYAFVMPETEKILDQILDGDQASEGREALRALYREAWTKKQDSLHHEFFDTWLGWSSPVVDLDRNCFPHQYPTAGASEALREAVNAYGNRARNEKFSPIIHVFDGEYEGYAAYANAAGIAVKQHSRSDWKTMPGKIGPNDQIYLSQPSAIDGNVWPDYDSFMETLHKAQPQAQVILDLTYVGAVAKPYHINANHPNIAMSVFSLSKPLGVYYHRIGGVLSREEIPGLYGNMWFKNILSLKFGTALMRHHKIYDLPCRYADVQKEAAGSVGRALDLNLSLSDVWLLATATPKPQIGAIELFLQRGTTRDSKIRVCLTPMIDRIVNSPASPAPSGNMP